MERAIIRPACENDIISIEQLQRQWCDENITWGFIPDTVEGINSYVGNYCYVAEADSKLVGFITGLVTPKPDMAALPADRPCLDVADLYVVPSYRSHGIGSSLLNSLIAAANTSGITCFRLYSGTKNIARVISFYERHGFSVVNVNMVRTLSQVEES